MYSNFILSFVFKGIVKIGYTLKTSKLSRCL